MILVTEIYSLFECKIRRN